MSVLMEPEWHAMGLCRTGAHPLEWWFPDRGEDIGRAVSICVRCPVIDECAAHGIAHEEHGIWGGLSGRARRDIRRARGVVLTEGDQPW